MANKPDDTKDETASDTESSTSESSADDNPGTRRVAQLAVEAIGVQTRILEALGKKTALPSSASWECQQTARRLDALSRRVSDPELFDDQEERVLGLLSRRRASAGTLAAATGTTVMSSQQQQPRHIPLKAKFQGAARKARTFSAGANAFYEAGRQGEKKETNPAAVAPSPTVKLKVSRTSNQRTMLINALLSETDLSGWSNWVIHPDSWRLSAWHLTIVLLALYVIMLVPIGLAFETMPPLSVVVATEAAFVIDIGVVFSTGYVDGPVICMTPAKIARHYYYERGFWSDMVAAVPFGVGSMLVRDGLPKQLLLLLCLTKLLKVRRIYVVFVEPLIEKAIDASAISRAGLSLANLTLSYMLLIHWTACLYWLVAKKSESDWSAKRGWTPETWLESKAARRGFCPHYSMLTKRFDQQYAFACHWAAHATYSGLPASKGSQAVPLRQIQALFETYCLLLGILVLASMIGAFGAVIDEFRTGDRGRKDMLKELDRYFRTRNVPEDVRITTRRYILFLHDRRILTRASPATQILDQLPDGLRSHLDSASRVAIVKASRLLAACEDATCRQIAARMRTVVAHPLQVVCTQGRACPGISVVGVGSIMIYVRSAPWPKTLSFLERYDTFGADTIANNDNPKPLCFYSAVARDFAELLVLRGKDVLDLKRHNMDFNIVYSRGARKARDALCNRVARVVLRPFVRHTLLKRRRSSDELLNQDCSHREFPIVLRRASRIVCAPPAQHVGGSLPVALHRHHQQYNRTDVAPKRLSDPDGLNTRRVNSRLEPFGALVRDNEALPIDDDDEPRPRKRGSIFSRTHAVAAYITGRSSSRASAMSGLASEDESTQTAQKIMYG